MISIRQYGGPKVAGLRLDAVLLFVCLISPADDAGRLDVDGRAIRAALFALRDDVQATTIAEPRDAIVGAARLSL